MQAEVASQGKELKDTSPLVTAGWGPRGLSWKLLPPLLPVLPRQKVNTGPERAQARTAGEGACPGQRSLEPVTDQAAALCSFWPRHSAFM